jgi:hypothetical protein
MTIKTRLNIPRATEAVDGELPWHSIRVTTKKSLTRCVVLIQKMSFLASQFILL